MTRMHSPSTEHSLLSTSPVLLGGAVTVAADPAPWNASRIARASARSSPDDDAPHYGINTGFGKFARTRISAADAVTLQHNLLRSHCAAAGPALDDGTVRLMIVLRANSLLSGRSGVSPELVDAPARSDSTAASPRWCRRTDRWGRAATSRRSRTSRSR